MDMIESFKAARSAATPLVLVRGMDNESTQLTIGEQFSDQPLISWDGGRGIRPLNAEGVAAMRVAKIEKGPMTAVDAMAAAERFAEGPKGSPGDRTIFFCHNPQMFMTGQDPDTASFVQSVRNLRDPFKTKHAQWVGLGGPWSILPPEIRSDVTVLDEPLPSDAELEAVVKFQHQAVKMPEPSKKVLARAVDALRGLSAFAAEQVTAMSLIDGKLDMEGLWERKRQMIEATAGLSIWRGKESLAEVYGLDNLIDYIKPLLQHVSVVLFMDEIEKSMAGAEGDTSGVAQALHRYLLTYMSDREILAVLLVGPPGTGKSLLAKATGNHAGIPTIALDIDGLKGRFIGESEGNCRSAFGVVDAVGKGKILLLATCNSIEALSPELRSRFLDTFFVELPNKQARTAMWQQYGKEFGVSDQEIPEDEGWTGREIKGCCRKSKLRGVNLKDAAKYVIPISVSASERISSLRERSSGRFLDAAKPGIYEYEYKMNTGRGMRAISMPLTSNN